MRKKSIKKRNKGTGCLVLMDGTRNEANKKWRKGGKGRSRGARKGEEGAGVEEGGRGEKLFPNHRRTHRAVESKKTKYQRVTLREKNRAPRVWCDDEVSRGW